MSNIAEYKSILERHLRTYNLLNTTYQHVHCDQIEMFDVILSRHNVDVKLKKPGVRTPKTYINIQAFEYAASVFEETKNDLKHIFMLSLVDDKKEMVGVMIHNTMYPEYYKSILEQIEHSKELYYAINPGHAFIIDCIKKLNALKDYVCRQMEKEEKEEKEGVSLKEVLETIIKHASSNSATMLSQGKTIQGMMEDVVLASWADKSLRDHSDLLEKLIISKRG